MTPQITVEHITDESQLIPFLEGLIKTLPDVEFEKRTLQDPTGNLWRHDGTKWVIVGQADDHITYEP